VMLKYCAVIGHTYCLNNPSIKCWPNDLIDIIIYAMCMSVR